MLQIINLHLAYREKAVLTDLCLDLPLHSIQGIVGLNGAGKTTLLNAIYGKIKHQKGQITFNNSPLHREQIAFLETQNFFYSRITGKEYLELFRLKNPAFRYEEWNKIFELPLKNLVNTYSTGMKKKLAFLGVLSLNRPLIILDEPFNGLDLETNEHLKDILLLLKKHKKTLIVTSHILETLTNICDAIHYLNEGKIESSFEKGNYEKLSGLLASHRFGELDGLMEDFI